MKKVPPKWLNSIENKSTVLRKKICQLPITNFTNHQKEKRQKFYKKYGNIRMQTLQFKLTLLKQDLKATSVRLRWLKKNHARQAINSKFNSNTKLVYHDFKANETPTKNEVKEFWKSIWELETKFNKKSG